LRSGQASSYTIIKGALVDETYAAFRQWDLGRDQKHNLAALRDSNAIGARSTSWLRDVVRVLSRRFDTDGRDRPLVRLAQGGCSLDVWRPLLLWHMTRDEFLVRDFLTNWLYRRYEEGQYRLSVDDVVPYLQELPGKGVTSKGSWAETTLRRVASGLLSIAVEFGLMCGRQSREFRSYHLPDDSLLYVLHALAETEPNAMRMVGSPDWRLYLMGAEDVERELLRLHQYRRLHYEVAGSLSRLDLPYQSLGSFVEAMIG